MRPVLAEQSNPKKCKALITRLAKSLTMSTLFRLFLLSNQSAKLWSEKQGLRSFFYQNKQPKGCKRTLLAFFWCSFQKNCFRQGKKMKQPEGLDLAFCGTARELCLQKRTKRNLRSLQVYRLCSFRRKLAPVCKRTLLAPYVFFKVRYAY